MTFASGFHSSWSSWDTARSWNAFRSLPILRVCGQKIAWGCFRSSPTLSTTGQPSLQNTRSAFLVQTMTAPDFRIFARSCSAVHIRYDLPDPFWPTISMCSGCGSFASARPQMRANCGPSSDQGTRSGGWKLGSRR